nr:K(+) efflux antiporter 5 isoform X1 [Ipomoea batatas]
MVSELAGEGAMPLPKPASHAELQVRLRRKIHRGSVLHSGVTKSKQDFLHAISSFNLLSLQISEDRSGVLVFQSSVSQSRFVKILSKVLISFSFAVFNRSRSVNSSRVLDRVDAMFAVFGRDSWRRSNESLSAVLVPPCVVISVHRTAPGYGKVSIAKVFSCEVFYRVIEEEFSKNDQHKDSEKSNFNGSVADQEVVLENGGEELQASLMAIPIQNSAMVSRSQIFDVIVSAIGSLSAELVVAIWSPQRRTRKKKQFSDLKNRVGELRSEIKAANANEAKQITESIKRKRFRGTVTEIDLPPNFAVKKCLRSKLSHKI